MAFLNVHPGDCAFPKGRGCCRPVTLESSSIVIMDIVRHSGHLESEAQSFIGGVLKPLSVNFSFQEVVF